MILILLSSLGTFDNEASTSGSAAERQLHAVPPRLLSRSLSLFLFESPFHVLIDDQERPSDVTIAADLPTTKNQRGDEGARSPLPRIPQRHRPCHPKRPINIVVIYLQYLYERRARRGGEGEEEERRRRRGGGEEGRRGGEGERGERILLASNSTTDRQTDAPSLTVHLTLVLRLRRGTSLPFLSPPLPLPPPHQSDLIQYSIIYSAFHLYHHAQKLLRAIWEL